MSSVSSNNAVSLTGWWQAEDHVRIARIHLVGVLTALALGVQFALVLQAELVSPGPAMIGAGALGGTLTAYGLVMIFLFALPALPLVVGGLVFPPLIGAEDFSFPWLNRLSMQLYVAAWALVTLALLGGTLDETLRSLPFGGALSWPLASASLGLHALGLSLACFALNLLVTFFLERTGLDDHDQQPVLVWSLVTGAGVLLAVAVGVASLGLLLLFESSTAAAVFGTIAGDPFAYERLVAFVLHAGAAAVVLPAIGIAFEIVATFSRKAPAGGLSNPLALAALGVLAVSGSGVALIGDGASPALLAAQSGISLLAAVPASLLLYNLLVTFVGGAVEISAPLLHALNLVVLMVLGGLAGLFLATLSTGAYLQGSLFASAQMHFLLGGASTAGLVTALYYWWPRLMGRTTDETLGRWSAGLLFAGFLLAFFPSLIAGSQGLSPLTLLSSEIAATLSGASVVGSVILTLGLVVVGWDLLASVMRQEHTKTRANPWGATTAEWWASQGQTDPGATGEPQKVKTYDFASLHASSPGGAAGE